MFPGLPTTSLPLVRLFDRPYLFTVPAYQRPYAWTVKEAGQLFEDLSLAAGLDDPEAASPDYFLGTILLLDPEAEGHHPPAPFSGTRVYEVVDGQQRLVTIQILASVLRDLEDTAGAIAVDDPPIAGRLHAMIVVTPDSREIATRLGRVQSRDCEQSYLETHVLPRLPRAMLPPDPQTGEGGAAIAEVQDFFIAEITALSPADRRRLALYLMEWCHVVVIISRDIDRAHRLFTVLNDRGKPLERNDIIKAEVLRGMPSSTAQRTLAQWDDADTATGGDFETFLGHLRLIHGLTRPPIIAAVRGLVRDLGSERFVDEELTPLTAAFSSVRTFAARPESSAHPDLARALVSLNRIGKADWVPAAILAMALFEREPKVATQLMIEIERFAYLMRLLGYGAGKRQRRFGPIIAAIRRTAPADQLARLFEITRDEQRTISFHLKDLHRRNAPMSKLLLMRIEEEVSGRSLTVDPKALTVEHILPLRPSATSAWKQAFADAEERAQCQTSLGNLALVSERQNDRAKNKDFPDKLAIYREPQADIPSFVTNADILAAQAWLPETVRQRELRLLDIVARLLRIDLTPQSPGVVRMFG